MHVKLDVIEIKMVDNHFLICTKKKSSYGRPGIFLHGKWQCVGACLVWMKIG